MFETKNEHSIQGAVIKSWFKGVINMEWRWIVNFMKRSIANENL